MIKVLNGTKHEEKHEWEQSMSSNTRLKNERKKQEKYNKSEVIWNKMFWGKMTRLEP